MGRHCRSLLLVALGAALLAPAKAQALGLQPIGNFDQPIFVTSDPADPDRLFVVEREGLIKVVQGGSTRVFADLTSVVLCCESERGLFSIAPAPDFPQSGLFYVFYTGHDGPGNLHIAELRASGDGAAIGSLRNVLTVGHAQAANHNGGQLQFGPDGLLYAATGDGGSTPANAQSLASLLGKVLRIDPHQSGSAPYSVPAGNPFAGVPGAGPIWAYGLRNPWRFSFDRQAGNLLLADVGGGAQEEVDLAPFAAGSGRGANYGWDCREGFGLGPSSSPACPGLSGYTNPVFAYTHAGGACAITGGYVARDPSLGDLVGRYLYADLCLGQIRSFVPGLPLAAADRSEGVSVVTPVSFGEDSCGRLYVVEADLRVYRLTGSSAPACRLLRVSRRGPGRVTGQGISCPPDCQQVFPLPERVVLKANPRRRANFSGWRRACSGKGNCAVRMTDDRMVVARFRGRLATHVTLSVADASVPAGSRALLRVRARPCNGRRHDVVKLFRGHAQIDRKRLDRRCRARFRPMIDDEVRFRAKVGADLRHRAGRSKPVKVVASR